MTKLYVPCDDCKFEEDSPDCKNCNFEQVIDENIAKDAEIERLRWAIANWAEHNRGAHKIYKDDPVNKVLFDIAEGQLDE